jgi:hypothetical protein
MYRSYSGPGIAVLGASSPGVPAVPFEQPKNLFRYGEQSLWSTYAFAAGTPLANGSYRLFQTQLGASGQGFAAMTIAETNLKEAGRIPAGIAFDAYGISCSVIQGTSPSPNTFVLATPTATPATIGNLINIINNGVLSWDFTQTQVDVAPISLIGGGGGAFGAVAVADPAAVENVGHMNNGAGSIWLYRQHPVSLPGNSTFSILLRFGGSAAAAAANVVLGVKVALFGFYKNIIEIG